MDGIEYNEKMTAALLKNLDFSRYSARHKDKLWNSLLDKSVCLLSDDDLELIAAAGEDSTELCPQAEIIYSGSKVRCKNCPCKNCGRDKR